MADENDDLLNPDEIEDLLKSGGETPQDSSGSAEPPQPARTGGDAGSESGSADGGDLLDPSEIESLLDEHKNAPPSGSEPSGGKKSAKAGGSTETERLLDQAEADLAAAVDPDLSSAQEYRFEQFASAKDDGNGSFGLDALQDVELDLKIELGRAELLIDEVLQLKEGSVVPLDKLAGDPVDVLVNGRLIARGEVLVLNDNFCVRIAEILTPEF